MRIVAETGGGRRNADGVEHLDGAALGVGTGNAIVPADRLGQLIADGEDRIERTHRLLEDHGDALAADGAQLRGAGGQQILALEEDLAAEHARGWRRQQTEDREGRDALAAAGLADEAEDFAGA